MKEANLIAKSAPLIFVVLWATGFVGAKYGTIDAEPLIFLFTRFIITIAILLLLLIVWLKPKNIPWQQVWHSMIVGVFMHGLYLGGVFYAVSKGMPAGISALVVSLQPFFTALIAFLFLGERISFIRILFFFTALCGICLVLFPNLDITNAMLGITFETMLSGMIATIAISLGAVYQKRHVTSLNLWVGTTAQFVGAALFLGVASLAMENQHIVWSAPTVLSLAWLVLVLSIGAVGLLMYLIRHADATSVASLFFLVPVVALAMTWVLFDETMSPVQLLGGVIVVTSVALASRAKTE